MKPQTLSARTRSWLSLAVIACLTLLIIVGLAQINAGATTLRLFQSSPVTTPLEPTVQLPQDTASNTATSAATAPAAFPTWAIIVVALVVVAIGGLVALLLLRRR